MAAMTDEQIEQFEQNTQYSEVSNANTPDGVTPAPEEAAMHTVDKNYDVLAKGPEEFASSLMELKDSCDPVSWAKFEKAAIEFLKEYPDEEIAAGFGMDPASLGMDGSAPGTPAGGAPGRV